MITSTSSEFSPSAPPIEIDSIFDNDGKSEQAKSKDCRSLVKLPSFCVPSTQVELTISASGLLNLDQLTCSDPLCVVYLLDSTTSKEWIEIGKTETIRNNLNPEWKTKFVLDYRFEEKQILAFMIYDKDSIESLDFLGKSECSLGEIVSASHSKFTTQLRLPPIHVTANRKSYLTISSEELSDCKKFISFQLFYEHGKRAYFPKTLFVNVSKQLPDGSWILLHRTDKMKKTDSKRSFMFPTIQLRYASVCIGDNLETPLRIQVLEMRSGFRGKTSKLLGEITSNYTEILEKCEYGRTAMFQVRSPGNTRRRSLMSRREDLRTVEICSFRCEQQKTFMDHLQDGLEINFAVAIDFTSSNGEPTSHASLHYRNQLKDNPYITTIKLLGEILEDYSSSKKFHAYGFGAKGFPIANRVNHKFPLNFKESNPECDGVEGVLKSYNKALQRVKLFGPTCFAPIIREVTSIAKTSMRTSTEEKYFVLVILTDGNVCDPETTKHALVEASRLPMSVIIIGIGDEDFRAMKKLDSDEKLLRNAFNKEAKRDIVQFVEMRNFVNLKSILPITEGSKVALSRSVLAELPEQVVSWMNLYRT